MTFIVPYMHQLKRWLGLAAALLLVTAAVACASDPTATPQPTATPATTATIAPTATATPAPTPTPTAAPTATPTPTATPAPTATAAPTAPADPYGLAAASEMVYRLAAELVDELGHREAATPEEFRAAQNLKARFDAMGYAAEIRPFTFSHFDWDNLPDNVFVDLESPPLGRLPIVGLPLTIAPQGGSGTGPLLLTGAGDPGDLPPEDLDGKVILMQPEAVALDNPESLRSLKDMVNRAAGGGAVGAGIFPDTLTGIDDYQPLSEPDAAIPALIFPPELAQGAVDLLPPGEIIVTVTIIAEERESWNVIAELKGESDAVALVGAHYDVVPETRAGANDNTSGVAVALALAEALAGESLPFTIRFINFGAEEIGIYGSSDYAASLSDREISRIQAMLNIDSVAAGEGLGIYGTPQLAEQALSLAESLGLAAQPGAVPLGATGDHAPFHAAGIPAITIYGLDYSRIHTPDDTLEFVQPELLGATYTLAKTLLQSPEFPP